MLSKFYDVVVVGAGNAALCAALSAAELGVSVLVLERAPEESPAAIAASQPALSNAFMMASTTSKL